MVQRLPDTSMTAALASGGIENFGWGLDRHLAASTYDAINQNTRATGNWGKGGPPKLPEFPRPKAKARDTEKPAKRSVSVADLYKRFVKGA
jgi:hypothetical protein